MNFCTTRRSFVLFTLLLVCLVVNAQVPSGYYQSAKGKSGKSLKTALYSIIADHTERSYNQLWTDFKTTDVRSDGKIWDMYSNATSYVPGGSAQGANYKGEGDSYNREHSFPKSWFNDAKPMYTDLFHLYPTDGYVNNRRSNYPFGETDGDRYKSSGAFSKLGSSTLSGYSGIVFEPADEYKGDFARTYFYMATAYEGKIASWSSPMLAGNSYPAYADWALEMLLRWAAEDPVSEKEVNRNNAVYGIQHNRNPFIDYPGLEQYVWGSKTSTAFNPDDYETVKPDPSPTEVAAPVFSPASGVVAKGTTISITTETTGAYIYYTVNGGEQQVLYPPVELTINENTSVSAYAAMGANQSETVAATYTIQGAAPVGKNVYTLVTDASDLTPGSSVLIVCPSKDKAMGAVSQDVRASEDIDIVGDETITTETDGESLPYVFTLGGSQGAWTFYNETEKVYLALTSDKNKLNTATSNDSKNAQWTISISNGGISTITNAQYSNRSIKYNPSSPRFACYKSGQSEVALFALTKSTGLETLIESHTKPSTVYDLQGRKVTVVYNLTELPQRLPAGLYIVGGKKVLIK